MTQSNSQLSWKEAFWCNKGPETVQEAAFLMIKGIFMGVANIIPGVSGGTIALITGIYQDLLLAIRSVNLDTLRFLGKLQFKQAVATIHLRFLMTITAGTALAILSLAHIMKFVFINYAVQTWSFFFGLILASILSMGLKTRNWIGSGGIGFLLGTVSAYYFIGLIPVSTPETWWFILIAGIVVICTMILPGLSGSFLLLIMGKYEFIISALKQPFVLENFIMLSIFGTGCVVGIMAFSRVLSVMLDRYENVTMAVLTGIMFGSMRKIWPWKEVLARKIVYGKEKIISEQNVLPQQFDQVFFLAVALIVVGFVLVLLLEKTAGHQD